MLVAGPRLERCANAGPGGAGARAGGREDDRPAAACREDEVCAAQGDGFFGARSSQASALAVPGSGAQDRRGELKACPYKAARSLPGGPAAGFPGQQRDDVASASARLARERGARCVHFTCAYATAGRYQVTVTGSGAARAAG